MSVDAVAAALRCSEVCRAADEPVEATAPHAVSWVGVVLPGSWPARAEQRLPGDLLAALAATPAVRPVLLRRVGRSGTEPEAVGVVLAGTRPGRTWLRHVAAEEAGAVLSRLAEPGSPALAALATGQDPGLGRAVARPAVLVCTNGARDACCAREGRPAALLAAERFAPGTRTLGRNHPGVDVWESSHLGGHRFAPTAVVLPFGVVLGGLGPEPGPLVDVVGDVLTGRTVVAGYRGRSTWTAPEQAAEAAVRRYLASIGVNAGPDDVPVDGSRREPDPVTAGAGEAAPSGAGGGVAVRERVEEAHRVLVRHTGGRTFRVLVHRVVTDFERPASCGAAATPVVVWACELDADAAPGIYLGA